MGLAIGILMVAFVVGSAGFLIGRFTAPDRKVRKADLNDARHTINEVSRILYKYNDQLDIVGKTMQNEVHEQVSNYWRGVKVI